MQVKKSDINKIFTKLDLQIRSTKHRYGWLLYNGRKILRVHFSHGKGDIPGKITEKIRGQLRLSAHDFTRLIDCPLSKRDYLIILQAKGVITDSVDEKH